jgi:hypothetical protein
LTTTTESRTITFPLSVSGDHRRIIDATGHAVLFQGDAPWSLIANTTLDEATHYLDNRAAKGFNALLINLIEYTFATDAPRNLAGDEPFTTPGDFRTLNPAYMDHAQQVLDLCADRGMIVFLSPAYLGYPNLNLVEGWYEEVLANGVDGCRAWGEYLARRFGHYDNVIWQLGGDRNPGEATAGLGAIAGALRAAGVTNLFVSHVLPESSALDLPGMDWVDFNLTYTYEVVHRKVLVDWHRKPPVPSVLIESSYEGEHNASALQIRRQAYWSVLCGGNGHVFGNLPIWPFRTGWPEALDLPGSLAMQRFGEFFAALPWTELQPDTDRSIGADGLGEARGLDRATVAAIKDRRLAVAYLPVRRDLTIAASALAGETVDVEWVHPASGGRIAGDSFPAADGAVLTPPFAEDALLILRGGAR